MNNPGGEETVLIASRKDTSSSEVLASCRRYQWGVRDSALGSDRRIRWVGGGNRTATLGAGVEHRNRKTRQTADYGALEGTLPVAQRPGISPVTRHYLRNGEMNDRPRSTVHVALTRIICIRQIRLWEGVVRGTPLEGWGTDVWNRDLTAVRLADVLRVIVIFDNHAAHAKRQLIVDKGAGVDRIVN